MEKNKKKSRKMCFLCFYLNFYQFEPRVMQDHRVMLLLNSGPSRSDNLLCRHWKAPRRIRYQQPRGLPQMRGDVFRGKAGYSPNRQPGRFRDNSCTGLRRLPLCSNYQNFKVKKTLKNYVLRSFFHSFSLLAVNLCIF